ncbi:MAG: sugar ABC transporter ATP-binding protein [Rhizobiaceae bacterium]|nr:sugar ABC transporter ATP-binding protein [Rhizobiaceae bacterium]
MFTSTLEVRNVSKSFGAAVALRDVSLQARAGEVHAVIGENGAGKSTLMNIICGNLNVTSGELLIDGKSIHFSSPMEAQHVGISIAPQEILLAPDLTVAENVMLGRQLATKGVVDWKATRAEAVRRLAALDPDIDPDARAGSITVAQQQLVQITRATATGARLLIFDEPTAALTHKEAERLFDFIKRFRLDGGAILYISHRLDEILDLSDRISVLRDGRYVAELDPKSTTRDEMIQAMAGREVADLDLRHQIPARISDEVVLRVQGLSREGEFEGVSFDLRKGEILAIGGLIGSGRTEMARCLFGDRPRNGGSVEVFGKPANFTCPADAIRAGLVYLPEERKHDGIFPQLSVAENIAMPNLKQFIDWTGIGWLKVVGAAEEYIRSIPIKANSPYQLISNLSGGNQQKAILSRWLMSHCRILILDEPTRGIDVNAKREIQKLLRELAQQGLSVVYISSELQEIIDVSDRVVLMHEGKVRGVVPTEGATQESLLAVAMS